MLEFISHSDNISIHVAVEMPFEIKDIDSPTHKIKMKVYLCTHYMFMYTHVHTHVHTCTHMYTHVHTCTRMYTLCMYVHTCTHMYTNTSFLVLENIQHGHS